MPLQVASMCFIDKFSGASPRTYWGLRTPPDPQLTIADTKVSVQHMTRKMSQTNVLPWGGEWMGYLTQLMGGASPIAGDFLWGVKKFRQGGLEIFSAGGAGASWEA